MPKIHTICACGHGEDSHQSLRPGTVLVGDQKPCYGLNQFPCSCKGWDARIRVTRYGAFNRLPFADAVDLIKRRGWWYEWVS